MAEPSILAKLRGSDDASEWGVQLAVYRAAAETLEAGAPGLSRLSREALARSIALKATKVLQAFPAPITPTERA